MKQSRTPLETSAMSGKAIKPSIQKKLTISKLFVILFVISIIGTILILCIENKLDYYAAPIVFTEKELQTEENLRNILNILEKVFLLENIILIAYCIIDFLKDLFTKKDSKKVLKFLIYLIAILSTSIVVTKVICYIESKNNHYPGVVDKPILYIYPTTETDLTITLKNDSLITTSYPEYENNWKIHVNKDGNIYDYKTEKNYYALYWEGEDNTKINTKEGFIVKGEDTVEFLEEKLSILGLNEKERNEFIIYWLPELQHNKYNFIRFRTKKEINQYMPLEFSKEPDTIIRVYMDFKSIEKPYKIKKQKLTPTTREGFQIVEWGGRNLNKKEN